MRGEVAPSRVDTDTLPSFLRWLWAPRPDRGIHTLDGDANHLEEHSYVELSRAAHRLATAVRPADGSVDAIAALSDDPAEVLIATGAAWLLGAPVWVVPQPSAFASQGDYETAVVNLFRLASCDHLVVGRNSASTAERLAAILEVGATPAALRLHDAFVPGSSPSPDPALPLHAPTRAAVCQFTSGSTGPPKLIRVSSANLAANLEGQAEWLEWLDGEDAWSSWLPLNHDMGLIGALFVPMSRQSDLWATTPRRFLRDPWTWLAPLGDGRATVTAAPTFGYAYTTSRLSTNREAGADFSRWKVATIAAEPVKADVMTAFATRFGECGFTTRTFCPAYGMAEATLAVTTVAPAEHPRVALRVADHWRFGRPAPLGTVVDLDPRDAAAVGTTLVSCGRPLAGITVRTLDYDGSPLPEGSFGEIEVDGTSVAEVTTEPRHGNPDVIPSTPLRTGDAGVLVDGELFVLGRLGDGLKVRGDFLDCEGLENRLLAALGVRPGHGALAMAQHVDGAHVVLMVRRSIDDATVVERAAAIVSSSTDGKARFHIIPAPSSGIPRTSSGKPQRHMIWQAWLTRRERSDPGKSDSERYHDQ